MFIRDEESERAAEANPAEPIRFGLLEQLFDNADTPPSEIEQDALKGALHILQVTYTMTCNLRSNIIDVTSLALSWVVRIPELYISMVSRREPVALAVLAHFCLLLNRMEKVWWISGLGRHLLQDINRTLGKAWEPHISWPLQDLVLYEFQNDDFGTSSGRSI